MNTLLWAIGIYGTVIVVSLLLFIFAEYGERDSRGGLP